MSRLTMRGFKYDVNMSSEGNGVYNMKEYLMGAPEIDEESQLVICHDTITLNVVARDRSEIARHVARLYQSLQAAVDYYVMRSSTMCCLEAHVPGDDKPVYAAVKGFEFHQLNDPYDYVNGNIIQDASIVITREPWMPIPPQSDPFEIRGADGSDVSSTYDLNMNRHIPSMAFTAATGTELSSATYTMPTIVGSNELAFLTNFYRYSNIDIASTLAGVNNTQRTTLSAVMPDIQIAYATEDGARFLLGSKERFTGVVFPTQLVNPYRMTEATVRYWKNEDGVNSLVTLSGSQYLNYMRIRSGGFSYLGISPDLPDWNLVSVHDGTSVPSRYWLDVTVKTSDPTQHPLRIRASEALYAPFSPFIDVFPSTGGDLPAALYMKLTTITSWQHLDAEFGVSYLDSPHHMNSVVIASAPIPSAGSQSIDPGIGFYSLLEDSPYQSQDADSVVDAYVSIPTYPGGPVPTVNTTGKIYNYPYSLVKLSIPTRPGLYRAFVRFVVGAESVGRVTLRLETSRSIIPNVHEEYDVQRFFNIDMANDAVRGIPCLADFGVLQIGNSAVRSAFGEAQYQGFTTELGELSSTHVRIGYEFGTSAAGWFSATDLILLPMNENYTSLGTTRAPLARLGSLAEDQRELSPSEDIWDLASEYLYMSNLQPGGAVATIATDYLEYPDPGIDGVKRRRNIGDEADMSNPRNFYIPVDVPRRYWFLWYKDVGNGVIWSEPDFHTAVKFFAVPRYVTLPVKR